jgi:hypothetical protein
MGMLRESEIMQLLRAWEAAILKNHVVEEFERAFSMGLYVASCEICRARLFVESSAEHIFGRAVHEWCSGEKEA